jgi:hypothetical protein
MLPIVAEELRRAGRSDVVRMPSPEKLRSLNQLTKFRELARLHGGTLLSTTYDGGQLEWKCGVEEHPPWFAEPFRIRNWHWCMHCAPNAPLTLESFKAWGARIGLELLDDEYKGAEEKHRWRCVKAGHQIARVKANIEQSLKKGGGACPRCTETNRVIALSYVQECAAARRWTVVSETYKRALAPMSFRCTAGHDVDMSWNKMQQGQGCNSPHCPDNRRYPARGGRAVESSGGAAQSELLFPP